MSAIGEFCPLIGGDCIRDRCKFWTQVIGSHPQSGAPLSESDCAIKWLPVLMIETSKETRQAAAAIESFRNVVSQSQGPILPGSPITTPAARLEPRRNASQA